MQHPDDDLGQAVLRRHLGGVLDEGAHDDEELALLLRGQEALVARDGDEEVEQHPQHVGDLVVARDGAQDGGDALRAVAHLAEGLVEAVPSQGDADAVAVGEPVLVAAPLDDEGGAVGAELRDGGPLVREAADDEGADLVEDGLGDAEGLRVREGHAERVGEFALLLELARGRGGGVAWWEAALSSAVVVLFAAEMGG